MRLALAFGRTAGELEATMGNAEWLEWLAFLETEPVGEERMDWRLGTIAAVLVNANRGRHSRAVSARDFVFLPELPVEAEPVETLEEIARAWGAVP